MDVDRGVEVRSAIERNGMLVVKNDRVLCQGGPTLTIVNDTLDRNNNAKGFGHYMYELLGVVDKKVGKTQSRVDFTR